MATAIGPCVGVPTPPVTATVSGMACPLTFPLVWQGTTYASVGVFVAAVRAYTPGATYNAATCTFTAPAGSVFPDLTVSAAPSQTLATCPIALPATYNGVAYPSVGALIAAIEADQGVDLTYNATTCTITQVGGSGTYTPVAITGPVTFTPTGAPCPVVFPVSYNGITYTSQTALQNAIEAEYGVQLSYNAATCEYTVLSGPVSPVPTVVLTAVVACYLTLGDEYLDLSGSKWYTLVDCPPSQRAAYDGAGFSIQNKLDGSFLTMVRDAPGVQCGIDFTEPFYDYAGTLVGYLPY